VAFSDSLLRLQTKEDTRKEVKNNNYRPKALKTYASSKGKAIPLQAWPGPEGSRKLSLPDLKTVDT